MIKEKLKSWERDKYCKGNAKQVLILLTNQLEKDGVTVSCDIVILSR